MKIKDVKDYFSHGFVKQVYVVRDVLTPGNWMLLIELNNGSSAELETALGEKRSFSSLDTVVSQMEKIFGRVTTFKVSL